VGPRTGLDDVEKRKFLTIPGLELQPLGRPARNQSLYRLRYPDTRVRRIRNIFSIRGLSKSVLGPTQPSIHSCRNATLTELKPNWFGYWHLAWNPKI
jgi:hypothetical protein